MCPCCSKGRLYDSEEQKLLQFTGRAPVDVTRYRKQVLRCSSCGITVSSRSKIVKWTGSARSSIVLQKAHGMPFHRLAKLQSLSGVPVSASTLWGQCFDLWNEAGSYIYNELLEMAAGCSSFNIDDTGAKILGAGSKEKSDGSKSGKRQRKSSRTTTICTATAEDEKLVLYITGSNHAGENIGCLLGKRAGKRAEQADNIIYIMNDASSSNNPVLSEESQYLADNIIVLNCLAHGQRKFTELEKYYPEECGYFLERTRGIYHNEHECKRLESSLDAKLEYHKKHSTKLIENIYAKIEELFAKKQIEPNSSLGKAMKYWLNNKEGLTQFLRVKCDSLDNNLAERSLRGMILQRKNSLFFKTPNSAEVQSGLSSIVRTCDENNIGAFKYLNWLQDNWTKAQRIPKDYTPFAYRRYISHTELINKGEVGGLAMAA